MPTRREFVGRVLGGAAALAVAASISLALVVLPAAFETTQRKRVP